MINNEQILTQALQNFSKVKSAKIKFDDGKILKPTVTIDTKFRVGSVNERRIYPVLNSTE